jgi:two-component system, LytTR family, sensor kinase
MKLKLTTGKKRMRLVLHVVAWMIIFVFPLYWLTQQTDHPNDHFGRFYAQSVAFLFIFYLSFFWLVPKYWLAGKKWLFLLLTAGVITGFNFTVNTLDEKLFPPPPEFKLRELELQKSNPGGPAPDSMRKRFFYVNFLFTSILISGFCVGLRVSERLAENEEERKELEKEKLNSELAFLKNQISPHFFFNTLNNIYSLIAINQADAQDSVLKLSKMMRYLLYESEQGSTTLGQEVSFMTNYIDLMRLRVSQKVTLETEFPKDHQDMDIKPLIFVPFIENAFKHGISYQSQSFIRISLKVVDKSLVFQCANSLGRAPAEGPKIDSGIGLENVTKRLQLLYPGKHDLKISKDENQFEVKLRIDCGPSKAGQLKA